MSIQLFCFGHLTLFCPGGPLWPVRPKIVCRFLVDCATLAKFLDFVSFNVLQVSEELFLEKKFFCEKYRTLSKIFMGGTLLSKNQNFQKNFFFRKCYSICLNINFTWSQLYFEVNSSSVAQNFKFLSFFPWNFQFWPSLLAWP